MKVVTESLLTSEQAAGYLGFAPHTLAQWRWRGVGPTFFKVAGRVRYRRQDLDTWLESGRTTGGDG